jgi:hypothetical protein
MILVVEDNEGQPRQRDVRPGALVPRIGDAHAPRVSLDPPRVSVDSRRVSVDPGGVSVDGSPSPNALRKSLGRPSVGLRRPTERLA